MATRLAVTFTGVIQATGFIDITATDTCNFKFTTPSVTGDVEIMPTINAQALEFYTTFNADFNGSSYLQLPENPRNRIFHLHRRLHPMYTFFSKPGLESEYPPLSGPSPQCTHSGSRLTT